MARINRLLIPGERTGRVALALQDQPDFAGRKRRIVIVPQLGNPPKDIASGSRLPLTPQLLRLLVQGVYRRTLRR